MAEEGVEKALQEVLKIFDIQMDESEKSESGDYSEIISKTQGRLENLYEKRDEILERTGMSEEEIQAYGNNPNNFTKEEWEVLEQVKQKAESYKKEAQTRIGEKEFDTHAEKVKKKRPHRYPKRKHWMPL